jgi:murein DD-endopeptidase MepM/ murein hydrolase activator NlpD
MRPVDSKYEVSQDFGSYATAGVVGNANGNEVQQLVAQYGNYQPFGHAGQDIATPIGTPVYAVSDGTVLWAGWGEDLPGDDSWGPSGYFKRWALYKTFPGICTVIQHWWGISVTAHMSDAPLNVGDKVTEGQQIGLTGNTKARGQTVGAHVHIEALIDLSYTTGGGLIYGRTNPTQFYGGIAAQGTTTTPAVTESEEDFMGGTIDAQQAEDIVQAVVARVVEALDGKVKIHPVQAESIVQATTARTTAAVDALNTGKTIDKQQADDIAQAAARYTEEAK